MPNARLFGVPVSDEFFAQISLIAGWFSLIALAAAVIISSIFAINLKHRLFLLPGSLSLLAVSVTVARVGSRIETSASEHAMAPILVQWGWGWVFLAFGTVFLFMAGFLPVQHRAEERLAKQQKRWRA